MRLGKKSESVTALETVVQDAVENHVPEPTPQVQQNTEKVLTAKERQELDRLLKAYVMANDQKNKLTSEENKLKAEIAKLASPVPQEYTVELEDKKVKLKVGEWEETSDVIDPKVLFEADRQSFFNVVKIAKSTAEQYFSKIQVAKAMRSVTDIAFRIKKVK